MCHSAVPTRNAYGTAYGNSSHDFTAIEPLDSDGDGFSNLAEITARTFPGNASSKPSTSDTVKPTVTAFVIPATSSSLTVPITTFTASDNVGVTGYMVTRRRTAPGALSTKWTATAPTSFTFPLATRSGTKTLYAWAKDAARKVSLRTSAQVTLTLAATVPAASGATSNSALSTTSQNAAVSTSTTFSDQTNAMAPTATLDMTTWVGKWFKISIKNQATIGNSGVGGEPQTVVAYLAIGEWDSANMVFESQLYQYDAQTNEWLAGSMPLHYISGNEMEFLCWSQVTGDSNFGFTAQLKGMIAGGVLERATFKSVGGYHVQGSSQPGSIQQSSGWLTISGKMIPDSEVPTEILLN